NVQILFQVLLQHPLVKFVGPIGLVPTVMAYARVLGILRVTPSRLQRLDHAARSLYRDGIVLLAVKTPAGYVLNPCCIGWITAPAYRHDGRPLFRGLCGKAPPPEFSHGNTSKRTAPRVAPQFLLDCANALAHSPAVT